MHEHGVIELYQRHPKELQDIMENAGLLKKIMPNSQGFADDICILRGPGRYLQKIAGITEAWCDKNKLEMNVPKCGLLPLKPTIIKNPHILLWGEEIPIVKVYRYLGFVVDSLASFVKHMDRLFEIAKGLLYANEKLPTNDLIPIDTKLQMGLVLICEGMKYGLNVIHKLPVFQTKRLESVNVQVAKKALGLPMNTTSEAVRLCTSTRTLRGQRKEDQIKFARHLNETLAETEVHKVFETKRLRSVELEPSTENKALRIEYKRTERIRDMKTLYNRG